MLNQDKKDVLFREMTTLLYEYEITTPAEIFRTINDYQNSAINRIESANNEKQKRAITVFKRTLIKTFKKEIRILIKIINKLNDFINKIISEK